MMDFGRCESRLWWDLDLHLDVGQVSGFMSELNPLPSPLILKLDLANVIFLDSVEGQDHFDEKIFNVLADLRPNFDF